MIQLLSQGNTLASKNPAMVAADVGHVFNTTAQTGAPNSYYSTRPAI